MREVPKIQQETKTGAKFQFKLKAGIIQLQFSKLRKIIMLDSISKDQQKRGFIACIHVLAHLLDWSLVTRIPGTGILAV